MKINHIEVINLRFEYSVGGGFRYSGGICTARVTTLVLVHTDTGHVGIGSCYTHPGLAHLVIQHQLAPLLIGRDPREVEELWQMMYGLTLWYGRKGAALSALGALDVAFWDLRGKAMGQPVWQLLGGERSTCPAYASGLLWNEPDAMAAETSAHVAKGFRRMKMRLGQGEERDIAAVRTVRAAIGDDIDLMVDAGMRLNVPLAQRIGKVLE
ncbi:MAG TPA: mandelate racemase/muconate lactonizing enzyme family protein, partial [Abditibacteriaceae bacterium]|nr:mandelate racemase/muconate lactonizing enzyme family protein [Abditibacteriaceae bacterium]